MVECVECGKRLGFFEGYYHPTLGKKKLLCSKCFNIVQKSVEQWRDFILSNSFNAETFNKNLSIDWSTIIKRTLEGKKLLKKIGLKQNTKDIISESYSEITLNHPKYNSNDASFYRGNETM